MNVTLRGTPSFLLAPWEGQKKREESGEEKGEGERVQGSATIGEMHQQSPSRGYRGCRRVCGYRQVVVCSWVVVVVVVCSTTERKPPRRRHPRRRTKTRYCAIRSSERHGPHRHVRRRRAKNVEARKWKNEMSGSSKRTDELDGSWTERCRGISKRTTRNDGEQNAEMIGRTCAFFDLSELLPPQKNEHACDVFQRSLPLPLSVSNDA